MRLRRMMKDTWCWKCTNTKPGKYIKFFIMLILDLVDLAIDWFFYAQLQLIKPGLVYGPPPDSIIWCLFGFCISATVCLIIETVQNADDLFFGHKIKWLTQSLSNFLVIFCEDIPILAINLIVTICRDGDPTLITVIKASAGIAIVVLRTTLMLLIYWLFEGKKSRFTFVLDIMSSIGLFIIAGISISIQLLNTFPTDSRGAIQSTDPVSFNRMNYVSDKYLSGIGIFSRWPIDSGSSDENFIWLASINQVIEHSSVDVLIRTDYELNPRDYSVCFTQSLQTTCYSVLNGTMAKEIDDENSVQILLAQPSIANSGYQINIAREPAQTFLYKIGYLDYNLNKISNGQNNRSCVPAIASSIIYAKFVSSPDKNLDATYLKSSQFGNNFYSLDFDLMTVDKIWRTGVFRCQMSGDLGPKLNRKIRLIC